MPSGGRHRGGSVGRAGPIGIERGAGEYAVEPSVVVTLELDDEVATGHHARQTECRGDGFGPGRGEDHLLGARNGRHEELRQLGLEAMLGPERQVPGQLSCDRVTDDDRRVTEDERSVAEGVIDVPIAVDIPEIRPFAALEVERVRPGSRPDARRHATGDDLTGGREEGHGSGERRHGHPGLHAFGQRNTRL